MTLGLRGSSKQVPEIILLDAQRIFDSRLGHGGAEHLRLIYGAGKCAGEAKVSISWETLAQLRSAMERAGQSMEDTELLELVLVPWALDQVERALQSTIEREQDLILDFGDAPKPSAVRETLVRYGLLTED